VNRYAVIFERGGPGEEEWGVYVPDLPGCISTGRTLEEARRHIQEAIELQLRGLREEGLPIPPSTTQVDWLNVTA
jgi:predicted RNase H-like HicB family nuclease